MEWRTSRSDNGYITISLSVYEALRKSYWNPHRTMRKERVLNMLTVLTRSGPIPPRKHPSLPSTDSTNSHSTHNLLQRLVHGRLLERGALTAHSSRVQQTVT